MIGPPSIELESLSDALSRSAMFSTQINDDNYDDLGDDEDDEGETPVIAGRCSSHATGYGTPCIAGVATRTCLSMPRPPPVRRIRGDVTRDYRGVIIA